MSGVFRERRALLPLSVVAMLAIWQAATADAVQRGKSAPKPNDRSGPAAPADDAPGAAKAPTATPDAVKPPATSGRTDPGKAGSAAARAPLVAWEDAVNAFRYQDFDSAVPQLEALLYPEPKLDREREWRGREYLGAALWWQSRKRESADEFTALLVRNPQASLDPSFYPPQMLNDFGLVRDKLVRLGVIRANQKPEPEPELPVAPPQVPMLLAFMPFGVGQLANNDVGKGLAFMGAEVLLYGVSSVLYLINTRDGLTTGSKSSALEVLQITSGAAGLLVTAWGIIDSVAVRAAREHAAEEATRRAEKRAAEREKEAAPRPPPRQQQGQLEGPPGGHGGHGLGGRRWRPGSAITVAWP